ncbi:hypothetical protein F4818DRAFT_358895 [Hypoxylon cercidicola]|nr:hypothetical protein F4818DRAFT_358895 [Hypoxylon cercidicola]
MATVIIRVETMPEKKREVVDLTAEPDSTPAEPMPMPPPAIIRTRGSDDERKQEDAEVAPSAAPSWTLTPETVGRGATPGPDASNADLPTQPVTPKGKQPVHHQAQLMAQLSMPETPAGRSGAAESSSSSGSSIKQKESTTPPRNMFATTASGDLLQRKRSQDSPEPGTVAIKEEPELSVIVDDLPATPVKKEESDDSGTEEGDDDDEIQISPFKKQRRSASPLLSSIPALPALFARSPSPSPSSSTGTTAAAAAAPAAFHHPDFPSRPALRCPKRQRAHGVIERETSTTSRNHGRAYFRCRDCPGFGGFVCWADARGVRPDNPRCWCGQPAREDITGDSATRPDTLWYKCATDACRFRRYDWDDPLSPEEVNEYCGRQVYLL